MSKYLSELLGAREPMFSLTIAGLERASGNPSVDIRLTSEIIGKTHLKMRALGLDPRDTTGQELYAALMGLVATHDRFLAKRLGAKDETDVASLLLRIKTVAERIGVNKRVWVLKHSVAKRLIKAMPPKQVMKALGYRSLDSMLKREPIEHIYAAIRFAESPTWLNQFLAHYQDLHPSDFESRDIEILLLEGSKWEKVTSRYMLQKRHNIAHLKELGVILILPIPMKKMPGLTITVLPLIFHYINEIRLYSAYFKLLQVRPHFGKAVADTIIHDPASHAMMAGKNIHWRVIGRHFGNQVRNHPEAFEPHVQPEDLHWRKAEEVLYRLEPALHFWFDMDFVALLNHGQPVSFNLMDMAVSYVNGLSYEQRSDFHFRDSLWNEIYLRYMGQKSLEAQVLKQLDHQTTTPELFNLVGG